ncbi:MAG: hypothetical protein LIR46_01345 [Bacteroidota bacterium]|nr:hypothetical protein [Bacteroidota bacterium]
MENMMRDIDGIVSNYTEDFLYLFEEYRKVCSRTDLASYIVRAVSNLAFEIADELDREDEEEI